MGSAELFPSAAGERLRLELRRIYIVPTGFGWLWLGGAGLLQVVGIQLQSNGPLLMSFLLLGLFLLTLHLTAFNLQGLELACGEPAAGFAGSPLPYPVWLASDCRRFQLELEFRGDGRGFGLFQGRGNAPGRTVEPGRQLLAVAWTPGQRGLQRPGRLRLRSSAPLGLFRCWSVWKPGVAQLIYPARRQGPVLERPAGTEQPLAGGGEATGAAGEEDWCDLRPYRPGEGASRLDWKTLARGRGAHSKTFATRPPVDRLLAPAPGLPREQALEHLCERIWTLSAAGEAFGLLLAEQTIPPGTGSRHRDRCLLALALAP